MSVNTKVNGQLVKSAGLYSVTAPIGMADIYSTEEKEIGLWIDNKPLYAKTINFGALPNNSQKAVAHNISNIDTIVNISGVASGSTNRFKLSYVDTNTLANGIGLYADTQNVTIRTGSDRSSYNAYVTIFYTKTTDTPWSGKFVPQGYGYVSSGDIYSFEERQVGVFADGKPLYQKTVDCGTLPNNTTKEIEHGISNIDDVTNIFVIAKNPTSGVWQNVPTVNITNLNQQIQAWISGTKVHIRSATDYSAYTSCYITIQYTKTTDVVGSGEYVPSGDKAVHYDDTEQVIGTWFGETLYRKTINFGALPNTTLKNVAHGISNLGYIKSYEGTAYNPTNGYYISLPYLHSSVSNNDVEIYFNETNASIVTKTDRTPYTTCYITLEYTKTS